MNANVESLISDAIRMVQLHGGTSREWGAWAENWLADGTWQSRGDAAAGLAAEDQILHDDGFGSAPYLLARAVELACQSDLNDGIAIAVAERLIRQGGVI